MGTYQDRTGQIWWVTGASSGIGQAVAQALGQTGATVIASARSEKILNDMAQTGLIPLSVDVTDTDAVYEAVRHIEQNIGPITGVFLNAGIYEPMPGHMFSHESAERTFDVNVFGITRALDRVLPAMIQRRCGHVVLMSSVAGWRGLPRSAVYGASKGAIHLMAESLCVEMRPFGLKVQVVQPGFVDTPATQVNDFAMPFVMTPQQAARIIVRRLEKPCFRIAFPWQMVCIFRFLYYLPDRCYFFLIKWMMQAYK